MSAGAVVGTHTSGPLTAETGDAVVAARDSRDRGATFSAQVSPRAGCEAGAPSLIDVRAAEIVARYDLPLTQARLIALRGWADAEIDARDRIEWWSRLTARLFVYALFYPLVWICGAAFTVWRVLTETFPRALRSDFVLAVFVLALWLAGIWLGSAWKARETRAAWWVERPGGERAGGPYASARACATMKTIQHASTDRCVSR